MAQKPKEGNVEEKRFLTLLTISMSTKPNKMRTEECPSYWAINKNDKSILGENVETEDSSFDKFDNHEKQKNGAIAVNDWVKGRI